MSETQAPLDIAVVGVSALFPGSTDTGGFWQDILQGQDRITEVPPTHWKKEDYYDPDPKAEDKTWCTRGGFLSPVDFPAMEFGLPPNLAPATDASQLLALVVARQVLDDATSGRFPEVSRDRVSVILGVTGGQELMGHLAGRLQRPVWRKALLDHGLPSGEVEDICQRIADHFTPWGEGSFPGLLGNVVAGRIAHRLDLGGTNCVVDAACASALSALAMGIDELRVGSSDLVITGGVDTMNDPFMFMCFTRTPALSKAGDCRPFDADGDGTLLGEGLGMVALKRLSDAERDGDRIYAVIRGIGSSSDGLGSAVYAPVPEGQAKALRRAYAMAGYSPNTVELVEAHGTGTRAGDAAEIQGLRQVFEPEAKSPEPWVTIGSVKALIGHTKAAAGAAGLIKVVLGLHQQALPPAAKVKSPHPGLAGAPFSLLERARPWIRGPEHPRRASVSAFGFGGSNFHVALEEYTGLHPALRYGPRGPGLVLASGSDRAGLMAALEALSAEVDAGAPLHAIARQSQEAWEGVPAWRAAILARDGADLKTKVAQATAALASENGHGLQLPPGVWSGRGAPPGKVAFLFPGQGSQALEMGRALAVAFPAARAAWDHAEAVSLAWGEPLSKVVYPPRSFDPEVTARQVARLTETRWAQPALAAASLAGLAVLRQIGLSPDLALGHSFGELVALHAAGVYDATALVHLARQRGEAMAHAGEKAGDAGSMAAVLGEAARVAEVLESAQSAGRGLGVLIANHNAPDQVVLAGPKAALEEALAEVRAAGLTVRPLNVAAAFHSPLVADASHAFADHLGEVHIGPPHIPVLANADAQPYEADPSAIRARLAEQLANPVRFADGVRGLYERGARVFVEVGAGSTLTGLAGRVLAGSDAIVLGMDRGPEAGLEGFWEALGRLAAAGAPINPAALWEGVRPDGWPAPKKKGLVLKVSGTNPGRPYPPAPGTPKLPPPRPPSAVAPKSLDVEKFVQERPAPEKQPSEETKPMPEPTQTVAASPTNAPNPEPSPVTYSLVSGDAVAAMSAWTEIQRQTSAAHVAFQQVMHDSHLAYLRAMETSFVGLAALSGVSMGASAPARALSAPTMAPLPALAAPAPVYVAPTPVAPAPVYVAPAPAPAPVVAAPAPAPAPVAAAPAPAPRPAPLPERPATAVSGAVGGSKAVAAPKAAVAAAPAPAPKAAAPAPVAAPAADLKTLLLEVVADKTGYPAEMLDLSMGLASDLGVDSIKRVEILSALRAKVPGLPELDMAGLASLRTLAQVLDTLNSSAASAPASGKTPEARRSLLGRTQLPATPAPAALPAGIRTLAILRDEGGVGDALAALLAARGLEVTTFGVAEAAPAADGFLVLAGLDPLDEAGARALISAAFRAARSLARARRDGLVGGVWLSAQHTGGDFSGRGISRGAAITGGLTGLTRTAAREWPDARVMALDLERGELSAQALAERVLTELLGEGPLERGVRADGLRVGLIDEDAPTPTRAGQLRAGDVIVATGGARGVTATSLIALARALPLRFVLLGRTPLTDEPEATRGVEDEASLRRALLAAASAAGEKINPAELGRRAANVRASREAAQNLAAFVEAGSEAWYLPVDVMNRGALMAGLDEVRRRWGPVSGVVHGAGVLADALLADKEDAAFDRVFDTKVQGFLNLLDATAGDPLKLVAAFSSVAGRYGNAGQSDYAAANEVLNQLCRAHAVAHPGCRVAAMGWGPWDGGMVTPALRAAFEARGVPLLLPEDGARLFVEDALAGPGRVDLILGGRFQESPPSPPEVRRTLLTVSRESHPWLDDHRVQGVVVLPVVAVVDAFVGALSQGWPGLSLLALEKLKVLRGVPLPDFEGDGHRFEVEIHELSRGENLRLRLELFDAASGTGLRAPRYRAEAVLGRARPSLALSPPERALTALESDPYAGALFHGPALRVLHGVQVGSKGASADILNSDDSIFKNVEATDPRALDGALQLGLLWAWAAMDRPTLPTGVGRLVLLRPGLWPGPSRAELWATEQGEGRGVVTVLLSDEQGAVAALEGVELHAVPSGHG